jgi:hypothetical protein
MSYTTDDLLRNCGINLTAYSFIHLDFMSSDSRRHTIVYSVTYDYIPSLTLYQRDSRDNWIKEHVFFLDLKGIVNYAEAKIAISANANCVIFACPAINAGSVLTIYRKESITPDIAHTLPRDAPLIAWHVVRIKEFIDPNAIRYLRLSPNGAQYAHGATIKEAVHYKYVS